MMDEGERHITCSVTLKGVSYEFITHYHRCCIALILFFSDRYQSVFRYFVHDCIVCLQYIRLFMESEPILSRGVKAVCGMSTRTLPAQLKWLKMKRVKTSHEVYVLTLFILNVKECQSICR